MLMRHLVLLSLLVFMAYSDMPEPYEPVIRMSKEHPDHVDLGFLFPTIDYVVGSGTLVIGTDES